MMAWALSMMLAAYAWGNAGTPREVYVKHKAVHALVGLGLAYYFNELGFPKTGLTLVLALGVAKELFDQSRGGRFRAGDVAWTIGPATVLIVALRW